MLNPLIFQWIVERVHMGPHIDCFAPLATWQLPRYNSYQYDPLSQGINAMPRHHLRGVNRKEGKQVIFCLESLEPLKRD